MTKGVIIFAHNNPSIDYVKQAAFCSEHVDRHLGLPVSLITSDREYIHENTWIKKYFQDIIFIGAENIRQNKKFFNGRENYVKDSWHNHSRDLAYELSPYAETLVIDSDYFIHNKNLLRCFNSKEDLLVHQQATYLNAQSKKIIPDFISDAGVIMYWATVFYFKKTKRVRRFFDLLKHIRENWSYYRFAYQIVESNFRNDFAFSIAIHILNGWQRGTWPHKIPDTLFYITDRDLIESYQQDTWKFFLSYSNDRDVVFRSNKINVHVMNKLALSKIVGENIHE